MDWQQWVSLLIVAVTAGLMLRAKFRRREFSFERDTHCGCSATSQGSARQKIVFRARKGMRPEVHVKM